MAIPKPSLQTLPPEIFNRIIDLSDSFTPNTFKIPVNKPPNPPAINFHTTYPFPSSGLLPAITQANQHLRNLTVGRFYARHTFVFLFGERQNLGQEIQMCLTWLSNIGMRCAGGLRNVRIVYSKKKDLRRIEGELLPEMIRRGVRDGMVVVRRIEYPFRRDWGSVLEWV